MPQIRSKTTGRIVECDDSLADKLIEIGTFEAVKKTRAPKAPKTETPAATQE